MLTNISARWIFSLSSGVWACVWNSGHQQQSWSQGQRHSQGSITSNTQFIWLVSLKKIRISHGYSSESGSLQVRRITLMIKASSICLWLGPTKQTFSEGSSLQVSIFAKENGPTMGFCILTTLFSICRLLLQHLQQVRGTRTLVWWNSPRQRKAWVSI